MGGVLSLWRDGIHVFYSPSRLGNRTLVGGVVSLCRDGIHVFYSPSRLGNRTLVGGSLTLLQRCNTCILQPQPTRQQDTRWGESYPSAEMQYMYSTAPANWATGHSLGGVLPFCRDAIHVFYSPGRLGNRTLVGGSLTLLQRCNTCILQPLPTRQQDTRWGSLIPLQDARRVFYSPGRCGQECSYLWGSYL